MGEIITAFGIDWRLIVIQVFNFALLMALLWYFLYTPILKIIDERKEKVEKGVRDSEEAAKRLATAESEKKDILGKAHAESEEVLKRATTLSKEKGATILAESEERGAHLIEDAEERAKEIKLTAKSESEKEIAQSAVLAAEKILKERA